MRLPFKQACEQLGISGRTRIQYRDHGMSELVADRMAGKAGLVAYEVWPDMLDRAIEAVTRTCAGCGEDFVPWRRDQKCCSRKCGSRARDRSHEAEAERRRYHTDPAKRARRLETRRAYYEKYGRT